MNDYTEQLDEMQKIINILMVITNKMDSSVALAGFMMLIEEYCRANRRIKRMPFLTARKERKHGNRRCTN